MKRVWIVADSIYSPLGASSSENFRNIVQGRSGLSISAAREGSPVMAATFQSLHGNGGLTRFEVSCSTVLKNLLSEATPDLSRTVLILSTTKGNIELIENIGTEDRLSLHASAKLLAHDFGFRDYVVVSNACISGVVAIITGKRFIQAGRFDHAVIVGADVLSNFIISGFQSLQALSNDRCRPFDAERNGINLGEGAGAILLTSTPEQFLTSNPVEVIGEGISNDANHISGPSRTGEELAMAINGALTSSGLNAGDIDFVSAHGTATLYNDEMEAKAFALAGLSNVPVNSLKGYYGHTLGAAGIIETVISVHSLRNDVAICSLGFEKLGVSKPLNICTNTESKKLKRLLKTASGFGGCNAALILEK